MSSTSSDSASMLAALYTTGNHSDLVVRACDGREFRVHKCIVTSKSGFFEGASRGGFKEAQSGVVDVEESGEVMNALFQHIYDVPIDWIARGSDSLAELGVKATMQNFELTRRLRAASDKYLVPGLERPTDLTMTNYLHRGCKNDPSKLTKMFVDCFEKDIDVGMLVRTQAAVVVAVRFKQVLAHEEAWSILSPFGSLVNIAATCALEFAEGVALAPGPAKSAKATEAVTKCIRYAAIGSSEDAADVASDKEIADSILDTTRELKLE